MVLLIASVALVAAMAGWQNPLPPEPPRTEIAAASGTLSLANSLDGSAVLQVANLAPGGSASGTVTLSSTGTLGGDLAVRQVDLADTPGPGGGQLSQALQLSIRDVASGQIVYSGPLAALDSRALGYLSAGEQRSYVFTVQLPDGGVPPSPVGGDNAFAGATVNARYVWDLTGDDPGDGGGDGGWNGAGGEKPGGGGTGGGTGGGGQPGGVASKMRVSVKVSAKKALKGRVDVTVRCSEPCKLRAYAQLRKRKLKTRRKSARSSVANKRVKLKLKLPKKVKASLAKHLAAKGKDYIVIYVRATDPRGGVVSLKKQVRVKRARR
jgi:hypothetical protein